VPDATIIPLAALPGRVDELAKDARIVVYCASGMRSSVGASFLRANGFADVVDMVGGYNAWSSLVTS
jgi:rhodanese-related sulfurtransferase